MRVKICGIRSLDFISKNGDVIAGTQIFYSHPADGVIGEKTDKPFLPKGFPLPSKLAPGKMADIFCDTKGRAEHIQLVGVK